MKAEELIDYSLGFFDCLISMFDHVDINHLDNIEHDLNTIKNKAIRSYNFIKHYRNELEK